MNRKFSLSYNVRSITPSHITVSVFSNMVSEDIDHKDATRGLCGTLVFSVDEFKYFVEHTQPHVISFSDFVDIEDVETRCGIIFEDD